MDDVHARSRWQCDDRGRRLERIAAMTRKPAAGGAAHEAPGDAWSAGEAYEAYMGRWSRALAREFLAWLKPKPSAHWLEVGCGTGALTSALCALCEPASVVACDPAAAFVAHARSGIKDARASFVTAGADDLPARDGGFDWIVSSLVLNFVPEPKRAVESMRQRLRPGGAVAACVWDYAEGVEFLRHFWDEAVASDPAAAAHDEGRRFPLCRGEVLTSLFRAAGFGGVEAGTLEIPTDFANFDDYWRPFLGGTGPAPAYVASLDPARREALRKRLERRLGADGPIQLRARAWAIRGG
jgi:SAM-dependent methyltransferase